jgi:hypothetical protein
MFKEYKEDFQYIKSKAETDKANLIAQLASIHDKPKLLQYTLNYNSDITKCVITAQSQKHADNFITELHQSDSKKSSALQKRGNSESSNKSNDKKNICIKNDSQPTKLTNIYLQPSKSPLNKSKQNNCSKEYLSQTQLKRDYEPNKYIKDQFNSMAIKLNSIPKTIKDSDNSKRAQTSSTYKNSKQSVVKPKSALYSVKYI